MNLTRTSALSARARTGLLASVALAAIASPHAQAAADPTLRRRRTTYNDGAGTTHSPTKKAGNSDKPTAKAGFSDKAQNGAHSSVKSGERGSGLAISHHRVQRGAGLVSMRATNHRNS